MIRFGNVLLDAGMCRGGLSTTTGVGRDAIPQQARTLNGDCSFLVVLLQGLFFSWWSSGDSKLFVLFPFVTDTKILSFYSRPTSPND